MYSFPGAEQILKTEWKLQILQRPHFRASQAQCRSQSQARKDGGAPKPEVGAPFLGVPMMRIIVYWGLFGNPTSEPQSKTCSKLQRGLSLDLHSTQNHGDEGHDFGHSGGIGRLSGSSRINPGGALFLRLLTSTVRQQR